MPEIEARVSRITWIEVGLDDVYFYFDDSKESWVAREFAVGTPTRQFLEAIEEMVRVFNSPTSISLVP